jgi:LSD1 subclass zinc finger protein
MRLQPDDIEDIKRMVPAMALSAVADYLGCTVGTVFYHARKLNVPRHQDRPGRAPLFPIEPGADEKRCTCCQTVKPLAEFYVRKDRNARYSHCRRCKLDAKIRWRAKR